MFPIKVVQITWTYAKTWALLLLVILRKYWWAEKHMHIQNTTIQNTHIAINLKKNCHILFFHSPPGPSFCIQTSLFSQITHIWNYWLQQSIFRTWHLVSELILPHIYVTYRSWGIMGKDSSLEPRDGVVEMVEEWKQQEVMQQQWHWHARGRDGKLCSINRPSNC